jgi:uncharacterized protein (TIGR03083 family)
VPLERLWLLGTARAEREALGRTIQYTEPDVWERESVAPGWRNRDIVAHLAASDVLAAAAVAAETPAELEEFLKAAGEDRIDVDAFNAATVERRASEPFRTVVREWGSAADLFLSRTAKVSPDDWGTLRVPWVAGPIGISYLVQSRVMEWWFHGEDIRAGGDNPPRLEHNPIFCVNDLAIRTIPYALGLAGYSFPGRTVKVDLEAVGGGQWLWGLAPREEPVPGRAPDCIIAGRAHAFALVAGRRVPAEYYLAEGTLLTGGDDVLAELVLQHLRAFA